MDGFKKITLEMEYKEIIDTIPENVKEAIMSVVRRKTEDLLSCLRECESPIEQLMAIALEEVMIPFHSSKSNIEIIGFEPQAKIKAGDENYRVDFLLEIAFKDNLTPKKLIKLVIECDGHEFHHNNKEQVKRDNKRIRNLESIGYKVLRFSGSEIYNDLFECKSSINDFIYRQYFEFLKELK